MNILTDVLFLFAFIMIMLSVRIPDVMNTDFLVHKAYLFVEVFVFYYISQLAVKINKGCIIKPKSILYDSLSMAIYCVVGYSLYVDMLYMDKTCGYFGDVYQVDHVKRHAIIALVMVAFVIFMKLMTMMFETPKKGCD